MKYLMVVLIPLVVTAGTVSRTFVFSPYEIATSKVNGYDLISLPGNLYTSEVGNPALPQADYTLLLPPTAEITSIEVLSYEVKDLAGSFNILPSQKPIPLSLITEGMELTQPNPAVYNSKELYPGKLADFTATGCMSGYRIAGITLYPVHYIPAEKKLRFYTELTVKINYEEGRHELISLSKDQVEFFGNDVKGVVVNPEDLIRWAPGVKIIRDSADYLIITGSPYVATLQPVADWKTKKGYYTRILSTDSIYPRYPGRDNAEKVRNCIRDYWQNKGTKWVLLAGDIGVVPYRTLYVNAGGTTDYIPSDLYFADLQWSYDGNRNNIFGECPFNGDTVDLYYDVYLGRASIDTISQANTFVLKDTTYEKQPELNYMIRLFLPCQMLWSGWPGDSTQNIIARLPPVPPWIIRKMYESQGQLTREACRETLRTGVGFVHFVCRGDAGNCIVNSNDVYNLTNTQKYIIANAMAGSCGAFEINDCFAEYFVNAPNGGAICGIFNSRLAWGYGSGPAGPSEQLDIRFYENFFKTDTFNFEIGKTNAISKHVFRNSAYNQAVWRWCYYELNLLGDPELPMWGLKPCTLMVTHVRTIPRGPQNYTITVRSSGNPLANALVCLWKGDEAYAYGLTDASGNGTLSINPLTDGQMLVTVTAKNHLPYESSCTVSIEEDERSSPPAREIRILSNPVRDKLSIRYSLPAREKITIEAFDITGRNIATIARGEFAGIGNLIWRPKNLPGGIYFIKIETYKNSRTESVIYLGN